MRTFAARYAGIAAAVGIFGLIAAAPSTVHAQLFQRWSPPSAPSPAAGQQASGGTSAAAQPAAEATQAPAPESPSDLFANSGAGAASGPESVGLNMVGDYLGGLVTLRNTGFANSIAIPLPGGALPRFKMSEDTSPIPTDRAYFIYDYYSGVPYNDVANGPTISLNGFTPGFEKTFLDGAMSVEVRLPMATTLGSTIYLGGGTPTGEGEIGNLGISVKALLYRSDTAAISGGLAIDCPTAANTICVGQTVDPPGGFTSNAIRIVNQSVHLLPFVGGLWTPNDRLFLMGYMQFDIDADGDAVYNGTFSGTFSGFSGPFGASMLYREQTMLYLDGTAGYWLRRNDNSDRYLRGIAVFGELHLDQSLDTSSGLITQVGTMSGNNISILDMTAGTDLQFGPLTTVTLAYCTPLTAQREFDGQFRLLLNRRF